MQCQLLLLKRSLSLGFFPLLLVSVLEGRAVFLTCGMLRSWGRAWKHQNFYRDHPVSLTAAFLGRNRLGQGLLELVGRAAQYLCCTSRLTFLEEPQGARGGLRRMF